VPVNYATLHSPFDVDIANLHEHISFYCDSLDWLYVPGLYSHAVSKPHIIAFIYSGWYKLCCSYEMDDALGALSFDA
jgi:hypothetical protein